MSDSSAYGERPHLYVVPPAPPAPAPPPTCRDTPRLPMRHGIGPRRRAIAWDGGWALAVTLSCGHKLFGEIAKGAPSSARCPMCAGSGPELYIGIGRRGYEIRRRARAGRPAFVEGWGSRKAARIRLARLSGDVVADVS